MRIVNHQHFLSPSEAAKRLGMSKRTIIRWCADGSNRDRRPTESPDLQPVRGPNGRLYFREDHIRIIAKEIFGEQPLQPDRTISVA